MSRKVFDKLKQAGNTVKTSFFKAKTNLSAKHEIRNAQKQSEENRKTIDGTDKKAKLGSMMSKGWKSINSPQLSHMRQKMKQLKATQIDRLKDINIKDTIKEGANKLKNSSEGIIDQIKNKTNQFQGSKNRLRSTLNKIASRGVSSSEKKSDQESNSTKKQVSDWFHQKVHNSQANWNALREMIQRELKSGVASKFNLFQNLFQKMYWRFAGLLFLIVFAYGLGSAIPREVRKALQRPDSNTRTETKEEKTKQQKLKLEKGNL